MRFVYLAGDYDTIAARLENRKGHYMPVTLLRSQFDTLEEPLDEGAVVIDVDASPGRIVDEIVNALGSSPQA